MKTKVKTKKKFDCWTCEYRGDVAGSAHSSCEHPVNLKHPIPPMMKLGMIMSGGSMPPMYPIKNPLKIKGNEQGIRGGWFGYPLNFDPIWLENCEGYKKGE